MNLPVIPGAGKSEAENRIRARRRRGNNIIEFSLMVPWYIFLFVGAVDSGFYAYSLLASQAAAREVAIYCAAEGSALPCVDSTGSTQCTYALDQLRMLPNVGALSTCGTGTTATSTAPVAVSTASLTGAACPDGFPCASVTVVYMTPQMIPIPGLLPGQVTITRTARMKYVS